MMAVLRRFLVALVAVLAVPMISSPAAAQATRTWVSGVGDDANPCSRTAPCKTFAGAIVKTAAGGEINCLDPGGYGTVVITKALAIVCAASGGNIMASGMNGIVINAGPKDKVFLSGLNVNGSGTGTNGIRVVSAKSVVIRDTQIHGFAAPASNGILVEGLATVTVTGSSIVNNTTGVSGQVISGGDNILAGNDNDGRFVTSRARQ